MPPGPAPFFRAPRRNAIEPAEIQCPRCGRYHVDREEWAFRAHHVHLCEHCDHEFDFGCGPGVYFRGVPPFTLRGRARALKHTLADLLLAVLK